MSRRDDADLSIVYVLYRTADILDVDVRELLQPSLRKSD